MATTRRGIVWEDALLDNVCPAVLFIFLLYSKLDNVLKLLRTAPEAGGKSGLVLVVALAHELGLVAIAALVVVLYVVRRPPVMPRGGIADALLAVVRRPLLLLTRSTERERIVGAVVAILGTFAVSLFVVENPSPSTDWRVLAVSAVLLFIGAGIAVLSLATLGRCFGIFPEARGLVTYGPYRWVRHPVYLGEIVAAFGALLPIISTWTVFVFAAFVALQLWRSVYEERALEAAIPEYRAYRERTRRLIPGVL